MSTTVIVTNHLKSSRVRHKPLIAFNNKTLARYCFEKAYSSEIPTFMAVSDDIIVAALQKQEHRGMPKSDWRSLLHSRNLSYDPLIMTPTSGCANGTERCFFAAQELRLANNDVVINVQGDMLIFDASVLDKLKVAMEKERGRDVVWTAYAPIRKNELRDPNRVKVLVDLQTKKVSAFSRIMDDVEMPFLHVGIYAYRVDFLHRYVKLEQTEAEKGQKLEQLRFPGVIKALRTTAPTTIDCESDVKKNGGVC